MSIKKNCLTCNKVFESYPSGGCKYCSRECYWESMKGIPPKHTTPFKKGQAPWNKELKGFMAGEKNGSWKGNNVGYYGIHDWLSLHFGKANKCENREHQMFDYKCNCKSRNYHWAKKADYEYERKRENFLMLCNSCHRKYDTTKQNHQKFLDNRYSPVGEECHLAKLTEKQVRQMRATQNKSIAEIAKLFNTTYVNAYVIIKNKTWKHLL